MRNWTEHGSSRLTAISDAGSTPAASTSLRPLREGYGSACQLTLEARLAKHNSGAVTHTSKLRPWRIKTYIAFADETRATAFEKI